MFDRSPSPGHRHISAPSAIFNIMLVLIPVIVAYVISISFSGQPHLGVASPETLAETRREIDKNFENFSLNGAEAREAWADLIEGELEKGNMSAVRGFLLAAPNLLAASDARAILAAADEVSVGSQDQRLLIAAQIFLPSDLRIKYEATLQPSLYRTASFDAETAQPEPYNVASVGISDVAVGLTNLSTRSNFHVLGTVEDLVSRSRDWIRGNRQRAFEMRLTGIVMASPPSSTGMGQEDLMQAASILKTAWRSKRLKDVYARQLKQKLELALPDQALTSNLELALADIAPLNVRAGKVQDAFAQSLDQTATARLGPELSAIARLAEKTGPQGVLAILEHVESPVDLQRARLLSEAGGDRAVALTSLLGAKALHISKSSVKWSRKLVIGIFSLTLAALLLIFSALNVISRAVFGPRQDDPII